MLLAAFVIAVACDVPNEPAPDGSAPRVIATVPAPAADDVDRLARMQVVFDRPLAPSSVSAASVRVVSGARVVPIAVHADPTLPGLRIVPQSELDPDARWELRVEGVRDLDGVVAQRHVVVFRTGRAASAPPDEVPPWSEIGPLLAQRCGECHGGEASVLGLDLGSAEGVRSTAIRVASRQTGERPRAGAVVTGLGGMTRIEVFGSAGRPEESYLVYKLLGDPHVAGERMPPPGDAGDHALSRDEIARVAAWIRGGAPTE
ncbi:Ig-like domain-containing protein [Sandaracinus amylolyticus]|uniref:SbsA Ig-like domain-containing protein n=1 Tax=Sandaracinus amylolyticus TaxID=927083 RepID=A0A0F6YIA0_9BACT|nr:Ig-like domain-containing protein [Sandaracinus amylolyticus]AKF06491.1 hypothetical protein DB32_003640 [Sandaracinus amylolyticus]